MGREEFEIIRSNIFRIIEVNKKLEKLLRGLQEEFRKYFWLVNRFVKRYYEENHRLPKLIEVYWVLRRNNASSTVANEVSKRFLSHGNLLLNLRKKGLRQVLQNLETFH